MSDKWTIRNDMPVTGSHNTKVIAVTAEQRSHINETAVRFCQALDPLLARFPSGQMIEIALFVKREGGQVIFDVDAIELRRVTSPDSRD